MDREELIALLDAVRADVVRDNGNLTPISNALQFAIWHLRGEPSFCERNDKRNAEHL